ncbi:MAG: ribosome small subunit-dependent GTPase A [Planktotalea sp.]|uniref:ribosome small subunit-dependent GTPase A n=1 Tax=Planktotalea sp. TaxID=2029877 RepID=UPI003C73C611
MSGKYDAFMPGASVKAVKPDPLALLGWSSFFSRQSDAEALALTPPVRIASVHRSGMAVQGVDIQAVLPPRADATVGDWLLYNAELPQDSELLERKSLIKRRSPGKDRFEQLIAANIDTAFIVTSCNADFNIARLERYVALAFDAEVTPVILITKPDLCSDIAPFVEEARSISDLVDVLALNAKSHDAASALAPWCAAGQTVAFLGSSGVGKSTLANALAGSQDIDTGDVRLGDSKGRHTTTRRQLHFVTSGCAVLDTPGMRELQLTDAAAGVGDVFADLETLATRCKFRDCAHDSEPGCAVKRAMDTGEIDRPRVDRWRKLVAEDAFNTASLSERKHKEKNLSKIIKSLDLKTKK